MAVYLRGRFAHKRRECKLARRVALDRRALTPDLDHNTQLVKLIGTRLGPVLLPEAEVPRLLTGKGVMHSDGQEKTYHGDGGRPLISKLLSSKRGRGDTRRENLYEQILRKITLGGASGELLDSSRE